MLGNMNVNNNKPRDGPATHFPPDPLVQAIYNRETDYFDLVLTAGWPLLFSTTRTKTNDKEKGEEEEDEEEEPDDQEAYQRFIELVQASCFTCKEDYLGRRRDDDEDDHDDHYYAPPAVLFYKPQYLHVTIATFYPMEKRKKTKLYCHEKENYYEKIQAYFSNLLELALQRPEWPGGQAPLELQIDSTQLGAKAGILLWKDSTGRVAQMRECLRVTAAELQAQEQEQEQQKATTTSSSSNSNSKSGIDNQQEQSSPSSSSSSSWKMIHSIPEIIHTSFLRFYQTPQTPGKIIQERYQSQVVPVLHQIFSRPIRVSTLYLICEKTPYTPLPPHPAAAAAAAASVSSDGNGKNQDQEQEDCRPPVLATIHLPSTTTTSSNSATSTS